MISLPFRVACILIAGFLIVLAVTYIYKLNSRKVFWGVGLTAIIGILVHLGEQKPARLSLWESVPLSDVQER